MGQDLSGVEVPRLVKKPNERKRVETLDELRAALADGWVLRLEPPVPDADLASVLTADLERLDSERSGCDDFGYPLSRYDGEPVKVDDAGPLLDTSSEDPMKEPEAEPVAKPTKGAKKK